LPPHLEEEEEEDSDAENAPVFKESMLSRMFQRAKPHGGQLDRALVEQVVNDQRGVAVPVTRAGLSYDGYVAASRLVENDVPDGANWDGSTSRSQNRIASPSRRRTSRADADRRCDRHCGRPAMRGLAGACYTTPEFLRWSGRGPASELATRLPRRRSARRGTAIRFDFLGRSALLLRGADDQVRGFTNVCRHRGSRLIDGDPITGLAFCVDARIRCPSHGWEYDDAGRLVKVPRQAEYPGLDPAASGLQGLAVAVGIGFVFIAFERPVVELAGRLQECASELEPHRLAAMRRLAEPVMLRRRANWKLVLEQALDSHRVSVAQPDPRAAEPGRCRYTRHGDLIRVDGGVTGYDSAAWSVRAYQRWLPDALQLPEARRRLWCRYVLWPNLVLGRHPDQTVVQILPSRPLRPWCAKPPMRCRKGHARCGWRAISIAGSDGGSRSPDRRAAERLQAGIARRLPSRPLAADNHVRWHRPVARVGSRHRSVTLSAATAPRLAAVTRPSSCPARLHAFGRSKYILMISDVFFPA
jgi:nitrite reductase/ring-hydroxylating ferredoxin subunit